MVGDDAAAAGEFVAVPAKAVEGSVPVDDVLIFLMTLLGVVLGTLSKLTALSDLRGGRVGELFMAYVAALIAALVPCTGVLQVVDGAEWPRLWSSVGFLGLSLGEG